MQLHGLDIKIEYPKGALRSGVSPAGRRWSVCMPVAYGAIRNTRAKDGEQVDAYVGPEHSSNKVFVLDQLKAETGAYDEAKVLLGFKSKDDAIMNYAKAFSDGRARDRIGSVTEMSIDKFRDWIGDPANTKKPVGNLKGYAAGGSVMPLIKSGSKAAISQNIKTEMTVGQKPQRQAVAIALNTARQYAKKANGGRVGYDEGGTVVPKFIRDWWAAQGDKGRAMAAMTPADQARQFGLGAIDSLAALRAPVARAPAAFPRQDPAISSALRQLAESRAYQDALQQRLAEARTRIGGERQFDVPPEKEQFYALEPHKAGDANVQPRTSNEFERTQMFRKGLDDWDAMPAPPFGSKLHAAGGRVGFAIGGMPGGHPFGARGKHMPGMPPPMPRMGFGVGGTPYGFGEMDSPSEVAPLPLPRSRSPVPQHLLDQQATGIPGATLSGGSGAGSAAADIATELAKAFLHAQGEKMRARATASPEERYAAPGRDIGDIGRNVVGAAGSLLPDFDPGAETEKLRNPGTIGENLTDFAKKAPGAALAVAPYAGNAERLAAGPGRSLMDALYKTAPRVGMTTLAAGAPDFIDAAQSGNPADARNAEIEKLETQIAQHRKAITDLTKETTSTKVRGKPEEANESRRLKIEADSKPFNKAIDSAQQRIDALHAANDADAKEAEARGAPLREGLPPVLSKTVPIWTGAIGAAATRGVFNKWNAEYNQAMKAYQAAEKNIDPVQMAVRKAQVAQLEKNTPWKNPLTYLAAGIPAELRSMEQAIDMRSAEDTRAHKEAYAHLHDPLGLGVDVGTNLLSAATALGLGAKYSKNQPERSLGQAISGPTDPYGGAPALADQYGSALRAGEALRSQYPNGPSGPSQQRGILQRLLGTGPAKASGVPGSTIAQPTSAPSPIELKAHPEPFDASALDALDATRQRILSEGVRPVLPPPPPVTGANQPKPVASSAPDPSNTVIVDPHGVRRPAGHPEGIGGKFATPGPNDTVMTRGQWEKAQREAAKAAKSKTNAKSLTNGKGNEGGTDEKKSGGPVQKALDFARKFARGGRVTVGPVTGSTGGRTDALPVSVPSGSFVLPADVVSALGEGNTLAGNRAIEKMFGKSKSAHSAGGPVPIKISDGEHVLDPEQVMRIGGGDMDRGHRMLDQFVLDTRRKHIAQLSSLPGPSR